MAQAERQEQILEWYMLEAFQIDPMFVEADDLRQRGFITIRHRVSDKDLIPMPAHHQSTGE